MILASQQEGVLTFHTPVPMPEGSTGLVPDTRGVHNLCVRYTVEKGETFTPTDRDSLLRVAAVMWEKAVMKYRGGRIVSAECDMDMYDWRLTVTIEGVNGWNAVRLEAQAVGGGWVSPHIRVKVRGNRSKSGRVTPSGWRLVAGGDYMKEVE